MVKKATFIGHRKIYDFSLREKLKNTIIKKIEKGCKSFIVGTHGEFDKLALSVCKQLRDKYNDIKIEVVVTSLHNVKKRLLYNDEFGIEYETPYSDVATIMYEIEDVYFKQKIIVSNQKMIDECDTLICYVNPKQNRSGAKLAMNYATRRGLKIINLYKNNDC